MEELIKQAEQGNAEAQFRLGMAYYNGDKIEKDEEKAFEWWMKAAEQGVEDAAYCLGCIHFKKKDFHTAIEFYLKAISDPVINEAAFQLGVIYENGLGVAKNKVKAIEYYKKGAAGINMSSNLSTKALKRLGVIHSWVDLGFNHRELIENAQYRYNAKWNDLMHSFSFLNSEAWLKFKKKMKETYVKHIPMLI